MRCFERTLLMIEVSIYPAQSIIRKCQLIAVQLFVFRIEIEHKAPQLSTQYFPGGISAALLSGTPGMQSLWRSMPIAQIPPILKPSRH